jgi:hypothetical protein
MTAENSRITIAATCFADAVSAIELGKTVAQAGSTFDATFITEAVSSTGLAFSVRPALGQTVASLSEAIERDARLFRSAFMEAVSGLGSTGQFGRIEADVDTFFDAHLNQSGMLIIGFEPLHSLDGEVILVGESSAALEELSEIGRTIAGRRRLQLICAYLEKMAAVPEKSDGMGFQWVNEAEALSLLGRTSAKAVVVTSQVARDLGLRKILYAARCPVLVRLQPINQSNEHNAPESS